MHRSWGSCNIWSICESKANVRTCSCKIVYDSKCESCMKVRISIYKVYMNLYKFECAINVIHIWYCIWIPHETCNIQYMIRTSSLYGNNRFHIKIAYEVCTDPYMNPMRIVYEARNFHIYFVYAINTMPYMKQQDLYMKCNLSIYGPHTFRVWRYSTPYKKLNSPYIFNINFIPISYTKAATFIYESGHFHIWFVPLSCATFI